MIQPLLSAHKVNGECKHLAHVEVMLKFLAPVISDTISGSIARLFLRGFDLPCFSAPFLLSSLLVVFVCVLWVLGFFVEAFLLLFFYRALDCSELLD